MRNSRLISVITMVMLKLIQISNSSSSYSLNEESDYDTLSDPFKDFDNFKENTLQRKYTILVDHNTEDCYFITDVKAGTRLSVDYMVTYFC